MATTTPDTNHQSHTTVAKSAGNCLRSFQECVQYAVLIHPRELSLVEDQLARFSVWTANIKVFGSGRASLDHRLREAPDVQDAVIGILEALIYHIQSCSSSLEVLGSRVSQRLDEPSVEIDPNFKSTPYKAVGKTDQSVQYIANDISLLHRLSNTIRRASKESQNQRAAESFRIRDDDGNDAEDFLTRLFFNYVRDRFPMVEERICQRLANTMVLRRKRILYKRSRFGDTTIRPQPIPPKPEVTLPKFRPGVAVPRQLQDPQKCQVNTAASESVVRSLAQSATTLTPASYQKASAPSVVSISKTVALNSHEDLVFPPPPLGNIKRKYNESMQLRKELLEYESADVDSHSVAGISEADTQPHGVLKSVWADSVTAIGEVTCPFCFYALPAQDVVNDKKWKLHVKDDLDAYVCIFEDCNSPHELYGHSASWIKHMREHALRWRCTSKSHGEIVFDSKYKYLSHMKTAHEGKFSDAQLQVLAERNGRVLGPLFNSCPLCGIEEVDNTMDDHIVGHLRLLALKSLPSYEYEGAENADNEKSSSLASKPPSRSTIRNYSERHTAPTFEDIGDVEKILTTFLQNRSKTSSNPNLTGIGGPGEHPTSSLIFPPPPEEDQPEWYRDPSMEFVEESSYIRVPAADRRQFEWGFIPSPSEASKSPEEDPILLTIIRGQNIQHMRHIQNRFTSYYESVPEESTKQRRTESQSDAEKNKAAITRVKYVRPKQPMVYCDQCDEDQDGFRGEYELRRHRDAMHQTTVKMWVCVDPATYGLPIGIPAIKPLSECKACKAQKKYRAYYNAAAHLRRSHFKDKSKGSSKKRSDEDKRGGKGGGDWPPMSELKDWMKEILINRNEIVDEVDDEDDASFAIVDAESSRMEPYSAEFNVPHKTPANMLSEGGYSNLAVNPDVPCLNSAMPLSSTDFNFDDNMLSKNMSKPTDSTYAELAPELPRYGLLRPPSQGTISRQSGVDIEPYPEP